MKQEKYLSTFYANIFVGLNAGYTSKQFSKQDAEEICQEFVERGGCVTVKETKFIYTGGNEEGLEIGFIKYPRFPKESLEILEEAMELAYLLMEKLHQFRCTIVTPKLTYLLENDKIPQKYIDKK